MSADNCGLLELASNLGMAVARPSIYSDIQQSLLICCSAQGVTCNIQAVTTVISVIWSGLGLTGNLQTQHLPKSLIRLDLSGNQLNGSISTLPTGLTFLNLNGNTLTSSIPTLPTNLTFLGLNGDGISAGLSGIVPALPIGLTNLNLNMNSLTGSLPVTFPAELKLIDLSDNTFIGSFPSQLPTGLTFIDVQFNQLFGSIPVLPSGLLESYFNSNLFTGFIPTPLPTAIQALSVNDNKMDGDVPALPFSLQYLYLGSPGNRFTGSIRINKPIQLHINTNYITEVIVTDASLLTEGNCDLSNNPLLGNSNIANLTMCLKNGLYSATELPVTVSKISSSLTFLVSNSQRSETVRDGDFTLFNIPQSTNLYSEVSQSDVSEFVTRFATVKIAPLTYVFGSNMFRLMMMVVRVVINTMILAVVVRKTPFTRELKKKKKKEESEVFA